MRTLQYHTMEKQRAKAKETLEIYAPLAHRLGMSRIKWELEDCSLRYLEPNQYYRIVNLMNTRREERERYVQETVVDIQEAVKEMSIEAEIYGRPKHIYSIYRKMVDQKKNFDEIYDLLAIRVLVSSIKDCYAVLGAVHTKWKPMPGRFKDYIAMPKANMYQSLHTTVIGSSGVPIEIQIRTFEMHQIAEFGVAAHWAYKEGNTKKVESNPLQSQMDWFRELLELQSDSADASEFIESVKEDIFKDRVYVFTPKGDVTELPLGAGPLNFAYNIHTEVGNKTTGAKVNGKIVPLNHKLKTGDIVEVITSSGSYGPSRDWINLVSTTRARNKIKRFFKLKDRDQSIVKGREALSKQLDELAFNPKDWLTKNHLKTLAQRFNFNNEDDLFSAIGFGELSALTAANRLTEKERRQREKTLQEQLLTEETVVQEVPRKEPQKMTVRHENGIIIEGADNLLLRLGRCCNPLPGDPIIGYITKGRGISVHRADCPNVQLTGDERNRLIDVEWEDKTGTQATQYETELLVTAYNRSGILNEVLNVVNSISKNLYGVTGKVDNNKMVTITLKISIQNLSQLDLMVDKIKSIADVYTVRRVSS